MRTFLRLFFALSLSPALLPGCSTHPDVGSSTSNAIVGGQPSSDAPAAGYLTYADTAADLDPSLIACGATLIAPNVVMTAAHCVLAQPSSAWAFGTGAPGSSPLVGVAATHVHPQYSASDPLRNYDLAYLILASAVDGVTPAVPPTSEPADGCGGYEAIGYDSQENRVAVDACIEIRPTLGSDPILEVHPSGGALCVSDGDYGSALVQGGGGSPVLLGLFVGSVTQPLTDCVSGTQYLDGYESAFGYASFFAQAVADGANALGADGGAGSADAAGSQDADAAAADAGEDAGPDAGA
jgi:hypothetical protein